MIKRGKLTLKFISIIGTLLYSISSMALVVDRTKLDNVTKYSNLNPRVLELALTSYECAVKKGTTIKKPILTVIDYSLPSTVKRLWVINLASKKILYNTLVAHGKNSGALIASHFSNRPGTCKSCLGFFVTKNAYIGHDGYSLVLDGLERGINDKAKSRHIIIHGAWYVDNNMIEKYGRIGRSWGCPAVNPRWVPSIINTIKEQTPVFIYYPEMKWLQNSSFLHC